LRKDGLQEDWADLNADTRKQKAVTVPQDEPVATVKIGIGTGLGSGRNHGHERPGGRLRIEIGSGLRATGTLVTPTVS